MSFQIRASQHGCIGLISFFLSFSFGGKGGEDRTILFLVSRGYRKSFQVLLCLSPHAKPLNRERRVEVRQGRIQLSSGFFFLVEELDFLLKPNDL